MKEHQMAEKKAPSKQERKSAAARAQEALDTQTRVVNRLGTRLSDARLGVTALEKEFRVAQARAEYLSMNPDLPAPTEGPEVPVVEGQQ